MRFSVRHLAVAALVPIIAFVGLPSKGLERRGEGDASQRAVLRLDVMDSSDQTEDSLVVNEPVPQVHAGGFGHASPYAAVQPYVGESFAADTPADFRKPLRFVPWTAVGQVDEEVVDGPVLDLETEDDGAAEPVLAEESTEGPNVDAGAIDEPEDDSEGDQPARGLADFGQRMSAALEREVGHPQASGIAALIRPEVEKQFGSRGIDSRFRRFREYAASRLNSTARSHGSEINGLCRLSWYEHLFTKPLAAPVEAEEFTRLLHAGLASGDAAGVVAALSVARGRMDVSEPGKRFVLPKPADAEDALRGVEAVLLHAHRNYAAAVAPLSKEEILEIARQSYSVFTTNTRYGHTINNRSYGRRLCQLLMKMDQSALWDMADTLAQLTAPELLEALTQLDDPPQTAQYSGVTGPMVRTIETDTGTILVGGRGDNEYRLDEMKEVRAVIDLGGNDVYREGSASISRPVMIVIDLEGDDRYEGQNPGVQGGAILGASILIDVSGDDVYRARDVAQGSALAGVGMLLDMAGDDTYVALRRAQGQALAGVGMLVDRDGDDRYHAALWAQGLGAPLGFGVLEDTDGADHYYVGGQYYDSYPETPGYDGYGQGVGVGIRGVANGGLGVLLDGGGDDVYEFDYFSHGGGYWLAMGFARDFGGDDRRLGATRTAYNGGSRTQTRYQRFGNGWGCHYALGFLIDDDGDDSYDGTIMNIGFAWDLSIGMLLDLAGNDQYLARGGGTQGNGAQCGLGILFDYRGEDTYQGSGQGYASSNITYHSGSSCGGNFSFVIDYGNTDQYGCRASNNRISQRGNSGGFIVDRPAPEEVEATPASAE